MDMEERTDRILIVKQCFLFGFSLVVVMFLAGCLSDSTESKRLARYRPQSERSSWFSKNTSDDATPAFKPNKVTRNSNTPRSDPDQPQSRLLKRGDKLSITIRDIPTPQDIRDVIDNRGCINLPLVGTLKMEGRTTSEAENVIEDAYIRGGYYKKINAIVVGGEEEYFIRGEVKREGKYSLSPELTLLQALAEAGGYTDYAKTSQVKIIRGSDTLTADAKKIEEGKESDPAIKSGDIILVPRRSM
jgi:protein involved in polysaccharide export with SLBB domain